MEIVRENDRFRRECMLTEQQKKIIEHAYTTVPFYINLARERNLNYKDFKDWEDIPVVKKEDLVFQTDSFLSSDYIMKYLSNELIYTHTSGSTGDCKNIYWSQEDMNYSLSTLWLRRRRYYGINPHDRHCYFFTTRRFGKMDQEIEDKGFALGFCKSNLSEEKLISIWKKMSEFQPVWLNLQPSIAILLANVVQKKKLQDISSLRYIELTGEMLLPEMKTYIENAFHAKAVNQYGSVEMNSIAFECPEGQLHCLEENCHIEILASQGRELKSGSEGEIYVTTLTNYAMPLIRYQLGDRGSLSEINCPCGGCRKVLRLTAGRSTDYITDEEGNQINAYIFIRAVENVNCIVEHAILQFQIFQKTKDKFLVKFVVDEEISKQEIERLFLENLWQDSLENVTYEFQYDSELLPDNQSGKLSWFINEYDGQ